MPKPELGKVAVGDELLVLRSYSKFRDNDPIPVRVVKAGRVWIDLATEGGMAYRMRLDTQNEGGRYSTQNRFVTRAQYDWERSEKEARDVLRAALVDVDRGGWNCGDRLLALAEFVRTYDEQHPA